MALTEPGYEDKALFGLAENEKIHRCLEYFVCLHRNAENHLTSVIASQRTGQTRGMDSIPG